MAARAFGLSPAAGVRGRAVQEASGAPGVAFAAMICAYMVPQRVIIATIRGVTSGHH
jgi:hypothetical protein